MNNNNMEVGSGPLEAAWSEYVAGIIEAIESGLMDDDIRAIARTCFARRDALKDGAESGTRNIMPCRPGHTVEPDVSVGTVQVWTGSEWKDANTATAAGVTSTNTGATPATPPKQQAVPLRRRRGFKPRTSGVFRYLDGKCYYRSDVIGHTFKYSNAGPYHYTVVGVGQKALKIVFVYPDGTPITDPAKVPPKYMTTEGGIAEPIFIGLAAVKDYVANLTPVPEGSS